MLPPLAEGRPARMLGLGAEDRALLDGFRLLSAKPVLYVCNVEEGAAASGNELSRRVGAMAEAQGARHVAISAAIEAEVATLAADDRKEYLATLGLAEPGLNRVIREGYALLDLLTFLHRRAQGGARLDGRTRGATAPEAAGVIHTDFQKGFICAEIIAYDDFVALERRAGCQGGREDAPGGTRLHHPGRRRLPLPLQRLIRPLILRGGTGPGPPVARAAKKKGGALQAP